MEWALDYVFADGSGLDADRNTVAQPVARHNRRGRCDFIDRLSKRSDMPCDTRYGFAEFNAADAPTAYAYALLAYLR